MRASDVGQQVTGMRQHGRLCLERLILPRLGTHGLDLLDAQPEERSLALALLAVREEVGQFPLRRPPGIEGSRERGAGLQQGRPTEAIEQVALAARLAQEELVGLPVDGHQPVGDLGQDGRRDAAPAGERATATGGGHRSSEEHDAVEPVRLRFRAGLLESGDQLIGPLAGDAPGGVDVGSLGARADGPRIRLLAPDQRQAGEHHRLARAGLPGEHCQAGSEGHHRVIDHAQRADAQLLDHASPGRAGPPRPRQPSTGSANLATRRSVNGALANRAKRTGRGS